MGDRGGRIVLLRRDREGGGRDLSSRPRYSFYLEFQSHEREFDCLRSVEIKQRIRQIKWCRPAELSPHLLSTNAKTVKLWKIHERSLRQSVPSLAGPSSDSVSKVRGVRADERGGPGALRMPRSASHGRRPIATLKSTFADAHAYQINSLGPSADHENFISADDLRINLWNLDVPNRSFNVVDIKPAAMEELQEVITSADMHPTNGHIFMYASSRGSLKLCDMRASALCGKQAKHYEGAGGETSAPPFFAEIVASVSDAKFVLGSSPGRYVVSRDFLRLKVWDTHMDRGPVRTFPVHEHLASQLCGLYESDCIFDRFECAVSPCARYIVSGSYSNTFHCFERGGRHVGAVRLNPAPTPKQRSRGRTVMGFDGGRRRPGPSGTARRQPGMMNLEEKVLHLAWSPCGESVAVAAMNKLSLFSPG